MQAVARKKRNAGLDQAGRDDRRTTARVDGARGRPTPHLRRGRAPRAAGPGCPAPQAGRDSPGQALSSPRINHHLPPSGPATARTRTLAVCVRVRMPVGERRCVCWLPVAPAVATAGDGAPAAA